MMGTQKISIVSRLLLLLTSAMLVATLFVPLWRIELDAPQYPEGLMLSIEPDKLAGDVEIINGLNHYIGMKELNTEDFIEFKLLPYLIGGYAVLMLAAGIIGRRRFLNIAFAAFVLFGVVAMIDFWRWEYDYGHDLNPQAAIQVPGMAYQPPLIGFKQLLNFGAYSIPDIGGWIFVGCGLLLAAAVAVEWKLRRKAAVKVPVQAVAALLLVCATSCTVSNKPEKIAVNRDKCDYCKMTISDARFASELITTKGRIYKFDDISCMKGYVNENQTANFLSFWVADFTQPDSLLAAETAILLSADELRSPMGGNVAAFSNQEDADKTANTLKGSVINWNTYRSK